MQIINKIVRHESVVEETRQVIEEIFTWLGESFDETLLRPRNLDWEQNSSFGEQNWTNANHQQYTEELKTDPSTVGRWKSLLTSKEIREIEKSAYHSLLAFGYEVAKTVSWFNQPKWKRLVYKLKAKAINR